MSLKPGAGRSSLHPSLMLHLWGAESDAQPAGAASASPETQRQPGRQGLEQLSRGVTNI